MLSRVLHILETLVEILLEGRASLPSCTCNTDASPSPQARQASLLHRPSSSLSASLVSVNFFPRGEGGIPLPLSSQTRRLKRHSEKAEDLTSLGGALSPLPRSGHLGLFGRRRSRREEAKQRSRFWSDGRFEDRDR